MKLSPSINAQTIIKAVGCPCDYFPAGADENEVLTAYNYALESGKSEGYVPVIIQIDDVLAEWLSGEADDLYDGKSADEWRKAAIEFAAEQTGEEVDEWFQQILDELGFSPDCDYYECDEEMDFGKVDQNSLNVKDMFSGKTAECIIAKIPVDEPWKVFAYVPFGGWNECPSPEIMMAITKRWYESYGAVPAVISHDTLQMTAKPISDKEKALEMAAEQFAFCSDIVFQGIGFIKPLAQLLQNSSVWYFWWD